uniref:Alcohol dehydrogenase-like C-terminal domain-containing protein n=1 Tax=Craspedostauros australis TaxID=1486917 RepID=A0A7S0F6J1_9STRA|mmetsp:Transcript_8921/g.24118  ORF Transcript_8921/g.24118 Transcript_8921/m.24118 type:complete len:284 (+) Transcript_8921:404-1255(+)
MEYGLKRWQTVMALTKCGGNARFIKLHPASLVNVPPSLDPAEVVCLAETYLTAFQVLHFGQRGTARYKNTSLKGKSVLIVGAMSNNLGKAMIDLATNANAAVIYATAKKKHWKTLAALGAIPLDQEESEWITRLEESMDLVLATNGANREDVSTLHMKALRPKAGHLIVCGHRVADTDIPVGEWKERKPMQLSWPKQNSSTQWLHYTHGYDVFDQWDTKLDVCQADLKHLLQLLAEGAIKPYVLDRIPLTKVPKAQEVLDSKRLAGHLVCEPWLKSKRRAVGL